MNASRIRPSIRPRRLAIAATLVSGILVVGGCANDAQSGAAIGAAFGALAGQALGGDTEATLLGAGIGAGVGYVAGNESDKAKAERRQRRHPNYDY